LKALILAGGKGTRLRPITFSLAKQLVPVANKPVIEYGIESIIEAGITDFGIIVTERDGPVEEACGDGSRWGAKFTYIAQPDPLGLAHAVATARPYLMEDDFIMYLGDNMIKSSIANLVTEFNTKRPSATVLLTKVPNPSDFGGAVMEGEKVINLEEKPKQPKSDLALVGVYIFSPEIHRVIENLQPSKRGEYEITEAIQGLVDQGSQVLSHIVTGWWKDTGTVEAMLDANRLVLEDLTPVNLATVDDESKIEGRVSIGSGTYIANSVIRGPVVIGQDCRIEGSFIGPFTAVANGTKILNSEVENSIVLSDCEISNVEARIDSSLLGGRVKVGRKEGTPRSIRLVLGEASSVDLP